jgi:hypothetical protein
MSLEIDKIQHIGNTLRRQIQDEFPELALYFIFYDSETVQKALESKKEEILDNASGAVFYEKIKTLLKDTTEIPEYTGLIQSQNQSIFKFFANNPFIGCLFIDITAHETPEDLRLHCTALTWRAVNDYMTAISAKGPKTIARAKQVHATPVSEKDMELYQNMLADAFAAIVMELQGQNGTIQKLARRRAMTALTPQSHFQPENYPFILCYEALQIIIDEYAAAAKAQQKPFHTALQLTGEIALTYEAKSMRQWSEFCSSAQEMAWMGADKNKILAAAIYSSEDPYLRATAHIVADALNIEPVYQNTIDIFNAFAEPEINQRAHSKLCESIFDDAASKAFKASDSWPFIKEAHLQNRDFINGKSMGWCAYGLIRAADVFEAARFKTRDALEESRIVFQKSCQETPWQAIHDLNRIIIDLKKKSQPITPATITEIAAKDSAFFAFAHAFSISEEEHAPDHEQEKNRPF